MAPLNDAMASRHEYFRGFDGLRGVAVSLVLLGHIVQIEPHLPRELPGFLATPLGASVGSGVDLFFVLSGFLITTILSHEIGKPGALRVFWVRRFLRIFPPYYALLLVMLPFESLGTIGWCAVYGANYFFALGGPDGPLSPTWSLAVEEHFYLVWPIVMLSLGTRRAFRALGLLVIPAAILSTVVLAYLEVEHLKMLTYKGTHARMLSLAIGCLLALGRLRGRKVFLRVVVGSFVVLLGALVWATLAGSRFHPLITQTRFALVSCTVFLVCLHAKPGGLVLSFLEWGPLEKLGRLSYGVYLYHMPVYFLVGHLSGELGDGYLIFAGLAAAKIVGAVLVAVVSFRLLERPCLALKDRWSRAIRERAAARPA